MSKKVSVLFSLMVLLTLVLSRVRGGRPGAYRSAHATAAPTAATVRTYRTTSHRSSATATERTW